jgi:hypothetical protein
MNVADVMVHRTPESLMMHGNGKQGGLKSPAGTPGSNNNNNNNNNNMSTSTQTNLMIPSSSSCRASDSLHSSNDSGFSLSNDLGHRHAQHQMAQQAPNVPPQPDIDYSDDEPQLSNR